MLPATFMLGNSAYDWKTMPTLRWFGARLVTSVPSMAMVPAVGRSKPGDHPERGRLAAARRAEEGHELAAFGGQVEVLDRGHVAEPLLDPVEFQEGHGVLVSLAGAGDRDAATAAAEDGDEAHGDPRQPEADERHGGLLVRRGIAQA